VIDPVHGIVNVKTILFPVNTKKFTLKPLYYFTNSKLAPETLNPYNFATVALI
jgi:hypothetical protein